MDSTALATFLHPQPKAHRKQALKSNGPCGFKTNDFNEMEACEDDSTEEVMNVGLTEVQFPENIIRKEEK